MYIGARESYNKAYEIAKQIYRQSGGGGYEAVQKPTEQQITEISQKQNVNPETVKQILYSSTEFYKQPETGISTAGEQNIKYYITKEGNLTYKVGEQAQKEYESKADIKSASQEISETTYEQLKKASNISRLRQVGYTESGGTFNIPATATYTKGFESELKKQKGEEKAKELITQYRRQIIEIKRPSETLYEGKLVSEYEKPIKRLTPYPEQLYKLSSETVYQRELKKQEEAKRIIAQKQEQTAIENLKSYYLLKPFQVYGQTYEFLKTPSETMSIAYGQEYQIKGQEVKPEWRYVTVPDPYKEFGVGFKESASLLKSEWKTTGAKELGKGVLWGIGYKIAPRFISGLGIYFTGKFAYSAIKAERPYYEIGKAIPSIGLQMIGAGITTKTISKIQSKIATKQYAGKPTTALQTAQPPILRPSYMDVLINYKPLQKLKGYRVISGAKQYEVIYPQYAKTPIKIPYSELLRPSEYVSIYSIVDTYGRVVYLPKTTPKTMLPSKPTTMIYDFTKMSYKVYPVEQLQYYQYKVSRYKTLTLKSEISDVRAYQTLTAYVEHIELSTSKQIEPFKPSVKARGKVKPTKWIETAPPKAQITYTYKLGGKKYLVTESGELIGGIKYGVGGETFIKASEQLKTTFKKEYQQYKPKIEITKKPITEKPTTISKEIETAEGQILIQKLEQPLQKQVSIQKPKQALKYGLITKVEVKQKLKIIIAPTELKTKTLEETIYKPMQPLTALVSGQAVSQSQLNKVIGRTAQKIEQIQVKKPKQIQVQKTAQVISQIPIQITKQMPIQTIKQVPIQVPAQVPIQISIQVPIQVPIEILVPKQKIPRPKEIPKTPPQPPPIFRLKLEEEKKKKRLYQVLVRRKGIFRQVARTETPEQALTMGKLIVSTTAGASFKVLPNIGISQIAKRILPREQFTVSKKSPDIFVERREKRIKSFGEKREITYVGLRVLQQKRAIRRRGFSIF